MAKSDAPPSSSLVQDRPRRCCAPHQVLYTTRHNITSDMTRCSKDFALSNMLPFGKRHTLADLVRRHYNDKMKRAGRAY